LWVTKHANEVRPTSCLSACYLLFTTLGNCRSYFVAFCGEDQRIRLAPGRATNDDQPTCRQRAETVADIAFILSQGLHQRAMLHADHFRSALRLHEQASQDMALQLCKTSCCHARSRSHGSKWRVYRRPLGVRHPPAWRSSPASEYPLEKWRGLCAIATPCQVHQG
jgi:hypothetical protein